MLRIATIKTGGEHYYFSTVAETAVDPKGLIEADPRWLGLGAARLGLEGTASRADVVSLLAGADPASGDELRSADRVKNIAYDLTFSVPKSVSIAHALARPEGRDAIGAAHDQATRSALDHIERELLHATRKHAGKSREVAVDGAIAVAFVHRTSRADDPHLHTHLLIANLCQGTDEKWSAVTAGGIYAGQRALRALFEAELRFQLTSRGIPLGAMRGLYAELAGIDRQTVRAFSHRAEAIDAELGIVASGVRSSGERPTREEMRLAADVTRPPKNLGVSYEELQARWRERALRMGVSTNCLDRACGLVAHVPRGIVRGPSARELTEHAASAIDGAFNRDDLLVARAALSPQGISMFDAAKEVESVLESAELVPSRSPGPVGDPARRWRPGGARERFTTVDLRARLADRAERLAKAGEQSGLAVSEYDASDRVAMLERVAARAAASQGSGGRMLAVAPGRQAAAGFEAMTGIDTVACARAPQAIAELRRGDEVWLADCHGLLERELRQVMEACEERGARPVLFGSREALERSPLLDEVRRRAPCVELEPCPPHPGGLRPDHVVRAFGQAASATFVTGPSEAIDVAALVAARSAREATTLLVVPDRAFARVAEERLRGCIEPGLRCRVVDPRTAAPLVRAGEVPAIVVVGGAASLGVGEAALASVKREHVLVGSADDLGRAAEAVRPRYLTAALRAVPIDYEKRLEWRSRAEHIETERDGPAISVTVPGRDRGLELGRRRPSAERGGLGR